MVQRGRPPTPIGGDGIEPWIEIEDWQTPFIVEILRERAIDHRVTTASSWIDDDEYDVHMRFDRISFPGGDHRKLRDLFDVWGPGSD